MKLMPIQQQQHQLHEDQRNIRIGKVDSVDIYEVKAEELDLLEKGTHDPIYFGFGIFSLSTAITSIAALFASDFSKNPIVETIFIVVAVIGCLAGVLLLLIWWRTRVSISKVIAKIRSRIKD